MVGIANPGKCVLEGADLTLVVSGTKGAYPVRVGRFSYNIGPQSEENSTAVNYTEGEVRHHQESSITPSGVVWN